MGCGEVDDSLFLIEDIQPNSLTTTNILQKQLENISFVLHIGDISYARGFSAVVRKLVLHSPTSHIIYQGGQ